MTEITESSKPILNAQPPNLEPSLCAQGSPMLGAALARDVTMQGGDGGPKQKSACLLIARNAV